MIKSYRNKNYPNMSKSPSEQSTIRTLTSRHPKTSKSPDGNTNIKINPAS